MENPNPPASPVATAEAPSSPPAAPATDFAAMLSESAATIKDPAAAQALREAFSNVILPAEPPMVSAPAEEPAAPVAVPEPALEDTDDGDDEPEAVAEAETPAEPDAPKLSRREREAQRLKAEVDTAVAAALAANQARQASEAALAQRRAQDEQLAATVAQIVGSPEDENALIDAVASGDFEAADKLKILRTNRATAGQLYNFARQQVYAELMPKIHGTKSYEGVDPAVIDGVNDITQVFEHIRDATTKAVEAKWQSRLERQKADYESRLGRSAAGLPTTETGGRAVGAIPQVSLADVQRMFRTGDWGTFKGREPEIMAAYQAGQLK